MAPQFNEVDQRRFDEMIRLLSNIVDGKWLKRLIITSLIIGILAGMISIISGSVQTIDIIHRWSKESEIRPK